MSRRVIETEFTTKEWRTTEAALRAYGKEGQAALDGIRAKAKGADAGLKALNAAGKDLESGMHAMAGRAGVLGTALSAVGTKGLVAAAGIGAVTLAVSKGLRAYAEEERAQLRLQAVLQATGNAAGVTATQIDGLAERLERTTFFKKEDILQAAGALASFKSVSGDAFESTIRLAADFSEVMGGDLVGTARAFGKAMQDPVDGLTALKRLAGDVLPPEMMKTVEALDAAGKKGEAVNLILRELEGRVGGAAQAAASGYAGAIDNLGDAFGNLSESIGRVVANAGLPSFLNGVSDVLNKISGALEMIHSFDSGGVGTSVGDFVLAQFGVESKTIKQAPGSKQGYLFRDASGRYRDRMGAGGQGVDYGTEFGPYPVKDYGVQFGPPTPGRKGGKGGGSGGGGTRQAKRELDEYIASLEEENRLVRMNTRDRAIEERLLRAENAARRDGKKLTADQRAEVARQAAALYDYNAALEEQAEHTKRAAEAQKELWRPVEHALERVQDHFADMLVEGRFSARSLVDIFKRAAAEIASAMIFRPVIGNIFGGLSGGGLVPGVSGSVTGAGGGAGGLLSMSGLSNLGSGLLNGFNTPILNPGIAFDIGSALGLSGSTVGTLHTALGNFTPMSGLASFGGSMLANAIGLGGKYSSVTGTIGGAIGTAFGGPIGGAVGSFLGTAVGGLFGGGKAHPGASYGGTIGASGAFTLDPSQTRSKHMGAEGIIAESQAFGQFLQTLGAASTARFRSVPFGGYYTPGGSVISLPGERQSFFNPADASSTAAAFRDMALHMARTATVVDHDLIRALEGVQTQGRDAAAVLQAVTARLTGVKGLQQLADALLTDPATSNLSPEELRARAGSAYTAAGAGFAAGTGTAEELQAAALAYLAATQGYAGKASTLYADDLRAVTSRLRELSGTIPPRFASGGDFKPGTFIVHPGETVMTSKTPGKVLNADETRRMMGDSAHLARVVTDLKEMFGALLREQAATRSLLERVTA